MGSYDSIFIKCECPYCKEVKLREFQTDDLGCGFNSYSACDIVDVNANHIACAAACNSEECQEAARDYWKRRHGYSFVSNWNRVFDAKIKLARIRLSGTFKGKKISIIRRIITDEIYDIRKKLYYNET